MFVPGVRADQLLLVAGVATVGEGGVVHNEVRLGAPVCWDVSCAAVRPLLLR